MESSPPTLPLRRRWIRIWTWLGALLIAGTLTILTTATAPLTYAAAQPTVAVALNAAASTSAQSVYTVTASGFAPQVPITQTLGDGSAVSPITGHTNGSGSFTSWWTLQVASTYCGTITAKTDTAQASASFWVAPASDSRSGTACTGAAGGGTANPTPATTPVATAAPANATPVVTSAAQSTAPLPATTPTATSETAPGPDVRALLAHLPWRWLGLGGAAVLALIVVVMVASGRRPKAPPRQMGQRASAQRRAVYIPGQPAGTGSGMRAAQPAGRPQPPRTAEGYVPHRQPDARQWPRELRPMPRRDDDAPTGAGEQRHPPARGPVPDQRWSRSQPGARTLRDATEGRQRAAQRRPDW